ncbi:protein transport protein [Colletotrichum tofieldiae]|nr:protein transport protein [Colletotrichum tofieldiae]GKT83604.1 YOS1 family protein [Colletotrichum tofieldiae]
MYILGNFLYIAVLLINAIAVLSEDRFLARINLSPSSYDPTFGASTDASVKAKIINLIASVRTLMRSTSQTLTTAAIPSRPLGEPARAGPPYAPISPILLVDSITQYR